MNDIPFDPKNLIDVIDPIELQELIQKQLEMGIVSIDEKKG